METPKNWAQALTHKIMMKMVLVQLCAAQRVQKKGGHQVAQACAAIAARESLLDGCSGASAIANGITMGMRINAQVNTIKNLMVKSCH